MALFLAFLTRKVEIKELNDSKSVSAIIYITTFIIAVLIVDTFVSVGYIVLSETLFSGGLMISTSVFLGFTFIPKVSGIDNIAESSSYLA